MLPIRIFSAPQVGTYIFVTRRARSPWTETHPPFAKRRADHDTERNQHGGLRESCALQGSPAPSKGGKGSVVNGETRPPRPSGHGAGATAPSVTLGAAPVPHTEVDVVTDMSGQNGRPQLHAAQRAQPEPKVSTFPPAPWHGGMVVGVNVNGTSARLGTRVSANGSAEVLGHELRL